MRHFILLFVALVMGVGNSPAKASENKVAAATLSGYSNSFIFAENGITFSVYPDGEFDFYIDNRVQAGVGIGTAGITFNAGFNYNPFVQYDDYGAVIQVQHVPIYYDYYGRVNRIGGIQIHYRNGLVYRLGGMRVFYTPMGYYDYHIGYINPYNRVYVYRPFHRYFVRPDFGHCLVYSHPYRRYYRPVRYTYYRPYHNNVRRAYATVGKTYRYHPRSERSRIYRNDHRVTARESVRSNRESLSRTTRSSRYSPGQGKSARVAENASGRSRSIRKEKSITRSERSGTRTAGNARNGSARVEKKDNRSRYKTAGNTRRAVKQSTRAVSHRTDRRIAGKTGTSSRQAGIHGSKQRNNRSAVVAKRDNSRSDKASKRGRRQ